MKRIKAACICQTLHFMLKENVGRDYALKLVQEEAAHYKQSRFVLILYNGFSGKIRGRYSSPLFFYSTIL